MLFSLMKVKVSLNNSNSKEYFLVQSLLQDRIPFTFVKNVNIKWQYDYT